MKSSYAHKRFAWKRCITSAYKKAFCIMGKLATEKRSSLLKNYGNWLKINVSKCTSYTSKKFFRRQYTKRIASHVLYVTYVCLKY